MGDQIALQNTKIKCGIWREDPSCVRKESFKFDVGPSSDSDSDCFENFAQLNEKAMVAWVWLTNADCVPLGERDIPRAHGYCGVPMVSVSRRY